MFNFFHYDFNQSYFLPGWLSITVLKCVQTLVVIFLNFVSQDLSLSIVPCSSLHYQKVCVLERVQFATWHQFRNVLALPVHRNHPLLPSPQLPDPACLPRMGNKSLNDPSALTVVVSTPSSFRRWSQSPFGKKIVAYSTTQTPVVDRRMTCVGSVTM